MNNSIAIEVRESGMTIQFLRDETHLINTVLSPTETEMLLVLMFHSLCVSGFYTLDSLLTMIKIGLREIPQDENYKLIRIESHEN